MPCWGGSSRPADMRCRFLFFSKTRYQHRLLQPFSKVFVGASRVGSGSIQIACQYVDKTLLRCEIVELALDHVLDHVRKWDPLILFRPIQDCARAHSVSSNGSAFCMGQCVRADQLYAVAVMMKYDSHSES